MGKRVATLEDRADLGDTAPTVVGKATAHRAFPDWPARVRLGAGKPSLDELRMRMRKFGVDVPKSTLGDAFSGRHLLGMNRAVAVVRACEGDDRLQAECRTRWEFAREGLLPPVWNHNSHRSAPVAPQAACARPGYTPTVFESVTHGEWRIVRLTGEWDLWAAASLRTHLDTALDDTRHPHIVVDLSRTTFLASVVLGTFVYVLQALRFRGASLRLVSGVGEHSLERVCRVFVITGLHRFMPVYPTLEEALAPAAARDGFDPFEPGPNEENSVKAMPVRFVIEPYEPGTFRRSSLA
jgi:anti-anti-sigma factor